MVGQMFNGSLWFNANKDRMRCKLEKSVQNSGVGITIGKNDARFFSPSVGYVQLLFDDGSKGEARVGKNSWNTCTHLINDCIGNWSRKNGLWKLKLSQRNVPVKLQVVEEYGIFRISMT